LRIALRKIKENNLRKAKENRIQEPVASSKNKKTESHLKDL